VILTSEVDETIIGGVVVRIGDTVYDASVKNRLQQLKRRAVKNATDAIRNQMDKFASGV
jgi:F-type H+-transporting ATPase subunit delta